MVLVEAGEELVGCELFWIVGFSHEDFATGDYALGELR
jgi:hypothetical protein